MDQVSRILHTSRASSSDDCSRTDEEVLSKDTAIQALKDAGCAIIHKTLSAAATVGMKDNLALSETKLFEILSYLRHHFGVPILASQKQVRALQKTTKKYEEMKFDECIYKKDGKSTTLDYWMIDMIATLKSEIATECAAAKTGYEKIGFNHGKELGGCITYHFQHDKGGDSTKFSMAMKLRQTDALERSATLTGKGCQKILENYEDILTKYKEICLKFYGDAKNETRRRYPSMSTFTHDLEKFVGKMKELLSIFSSAFRMMDDTKSIFNDEQCDQLKVMCRGAGYAWRSLGFTVTTKFHLFESHVAEQMKYVRNLGSFSEQTIEKYHHYFRYLKAIYDSSKGFEKKSKLVMNMSYANRRGPSYNIKIEMSAKRKRDWSEKTLAKRNEKKKHRTESAEDETRNACLLSNKLMHGLPSSL
jgi:hypothetical protein